MAEYITWVFVGFIVFIFLLFVRQAWKLRLLSKLVEKALKSEDCMLTLEKTKLQPLVENYKNTQNIEVNSVKKTNTPASEFFSQLNVCQCVSLNVRLLDTASGSLVGLGLLGTFLGLTWGIQGFDSSTTENIQTSIQSLLGGMGTAFFTSLVGMFLSLFFTSVFEKPWKNQLHRSLSNLTSKLDQSYYIDDMALLVSYIEPYLTYIDQNGEKILVANAIREIHRENQEQSRALKSFSTDLAMQLNDGFDEMLSRQMQQKLMPLMENIDLSTKAVVEHIDKMADKVESPATDMIQNVVGELKDSMKDMMTEFKSNISENTTHELEGLASTLSTASQSMMDFPKHMEHISTTLDSSISNVKSAIEDISTTSVTSNSRAMQQMQEQITFATTSISNAITEVKEVMSSITKTSEQSSADVITKISQTSDQLGEFLNNTMSNVTATVESSMKNITEHIADKQTDMLSMQESTMEETKKLLALFNLGIEKLEQVNVEVRSTMDMFQKAQGEITGTTMHLQSISGDMHNATELLSKGQEEYNACVAEVQQKNQDSIDGLTQLIRESGDMSSDYAQKFETIRLGLASIFNQLQAGLNEYSKTVQSSTQSYLDQYSSSLTQTTDALSSSIQQQNAVVEMLVEMLNKKN